jgi:K(+)-stimulated pyrophosphate-energized sodium pump
MKVVFKIGEDDPRNPGVIADCTGDNAGDSVGPTADGFETYGVTGVALVSFILLAITDIEIQRQLLVWIFTMRILGVATSIISFWINNVISKAKYGKSDSLDFEAPLTNLVWITSILSIASTFIISYIMIPDIAGNTNLWWVLSLIISCGTLGAAVIPEVTKLFTSPKSAHVKEIVKASEEGGASLNILSGFVAGNFSAFWTGLVFVILMFFAYTQSIALDGIMLYPSIFAFGLVAFGMLGMGPVTIAVDSYGPVTDNAQSVYELSMIEEVEDIDKEIEKDFGFKPDWEKSKYYLEANDGAGNTFKATAKPVLIGTAVVGATTMIFSLILMLKGTLGIEPETILNILNPYTILGFLLGGAVVYWFTGASTQAVTTGAYRAVQYIKKHINLDPNAPKKADESKSIEVVKICTQYAQKGMFNIFVAVFFFALGIACLSSPVGIGGNNAVSLFVSYLISIALFGLFQAVFMANAGGSWDNAKKVVEVDMQAKGTALHDAVVVGDTVGDPFKDTSSVALNPIIKFTTLFGLLAMEIAISESFRNIAPYFGIAFFLVAVYFVYRSFYKMRIERTEQ